MRTGSPTLNLRDFSVTDAQSIRAPLSLTMGWFFVRILTTIPNDKISDFNQHGIQFKSSNMIQIGWFKMYLNETQVAYARSTEYLSLIPVKQYDKPNFKSLKKEKKLLVLAPPDWKPQGSATIVSKFSDELFIVSGSTAEELFNDPCVGKIEEVPIIKPL